MSDGIADGADNCPLIANSDQANADGDSLAMCVIDDDDGDGIADVTDQCPNTPQGAQVNASGAPIQMVMASKTALTNVRRPRQAIRSITTGAPIRMVTVSRTMLTTAH